MPDIFSTRLFHPFEGSGSSLRGPFPGLSVNEEIARYGVLTYLDSNGTLAIWRSGKYGSELDEEGLQSACRVLASPAYSRNSSIVLSTGRALSGMKPVAPFFKDLPLQMLGTTNGLALFINHLRLPTDEWIATLDMTQQDEDWASELRAEHGWDQAMIMHSFTQALKLHGFIDGSSLGFFAFDPKRTCFIRPTPDEYPVLHGLTPENYANIPREDMLLVSFYPDGNSLIFENGMKGTHGIEDLPGAEAPEHSRPLIERQNSWIQSTLLDPIARELAESGLRLRSRYFPYRSTMLFDLNPAFGDGKLLLLNYLLRMKCSSAKDVVTAGDSEFDADMLSLNDLGVGDRNGASRLVRFHPIQVGNDPKLREKVSIHPRLVQVPSGNLADGLMRQWSRIEPPPASILDASDSR